MERDSAQTPVPKNLQFRVGLLVGLAVVLGAGFVIYALYARGVFEDTQRLTLVAENAEGVAIGMDLTFSGFPIGRVQRLALDEQGRARIDIDVSRSQCASLRSEEHTSELQSRRDLVCRLLLEKKKKIKNIDNKILKK